MKAVRSFLGFPEAASPLLDPSVQELYKLDPPHHQNDYKQKKVPSSSELGPSSKSKEKGSSRLKSFMIVAAVGDWLSSWLLKLPFIKD